MVRNPVPSPVKPADDEVQDMCRKVKNFVEEQTSKTFTVFNAHSYRTLVDYIDSRIIVFIKVQVSDTDFMHIRLYRMVPSKHGGVTLECFIDDLKESDALEVFTAEELQPSNGESAEPNMEQATAAEITVS